MPGGKGKRATRLELAGPQFKMERETGLEPATLWLGTRSLPLSYSRISAIRMPVR